MASGAANRFRKDQRPFEFDVDEPGHDQLRDAVAMLDGAGDVGGDGVESDHDFAAVIRIQRAEGGHDALAGEAASGAELGVQTGRDFHGEAGGNNDGTLRDGHRTIFEAGVDVVAGGELSRAEGELRTGAKELDADGFGHAATVSGIEFRASRRLTGYDKVATMWLLGGELEALKTIGVRQLKNEATQIVRAVKEQNALYVITVNGQPVATLRPYSDRDIAGMQRSQATSELQAIERLAEAVGEAWMGSASGEGDGGAGRSRRGD